MTMTVREAGHMAIVRAQASLADSDGRSRGEGRA